MGWNSTEGDYTMCNAIWEHLMILLKDYFEKERLDPFFTQYRLISIYEIHLHFPPLLIPLVPLNQF
jgi:hypothetical protein